MGPIDRCEAIADETHCSSGLQADFGLLPLLQNLYMAKVYSSKNRIENSTEQYEICIGSVLNL